MNGRAMDHPHEPGRRPGPALVARDAGEARWWGGGLAVIKASAADTGGRMTIVEVTEPPGAEAPLHVHHREDEAFWVLDGEVTLDIGGNTVAARAGDYASARGTCRTATRWVRRAAGCSSSSRPAASRT